MNILSIDDLCSELQFLADSNYFVCGTSNEIESEANNFVHEYIKARGLQAQTAGAYRWHILSDKILVEDGHIELLCKLHSIWDRGHCEFEFINAKNKESFNRGLVAA